MGGRGRTSAPVDDGRQAAQKRIAQTYRDIEKSRNLEKARPETVTKNMAQIKSLLGMRRR